MSSKDKLDKKPDNRELTDEEAARISGGTIHYFDGYVKIENKIMGTSGNDYLQGSAGNDLIEAQEGDDFVSGGAGDDHIKGGAGNDVLMGGDGRDTLYGGSGSDVLVGGDGKDVIYGGSYASDTISGGSGDDWIDPGYGRRYEAAGEGNVVDAGEGDDFIKWSWHAGGSDHIDGGAGNDVIQLYGLSSGSGGQHVYHDTVQSAWEAGGLAMTINDADGNEIEITAAMFDDNGDLILPEGCSGTVQGVRNAMTFEGIERFTVRGNFEMETGSDRDLLSLDDL